MYRHIDLITTLHGNISFSPQTVMSIHLGGIILYWREGGRKSARALIFKNESFCHFPSPPSKVVLVGHYMIAIARGAAFSSYISPLM
jgi:hypothetical protein